MSSRKALEPAKWNRKSLLELLKKMRGKQILVVGDIGLDRYTIGGVDRISPEAPVPIVTVVQELHKLGLAANVAENIRALGGTPYLVGVIGRDRTGNDLMGLIRKCKIQASHVVVDPSRRTILKERIVSDRQQMLRVDYESGHALSREIEKKIIKKFEVAIRNVDGVILQDYAKGLLTKRLVQNLISIARKKGKWVAIDPNQKTPTDVYQGAYLLTPNSREAESLTGIKITDQRTLKQVGFQLLDSTQAEHIVITRGKEGMALFSRGNEEPVLLPTWVREVYDVSGAGDTVIAVVALALACGAKLTEACVLGNLAAGVEVGKRGTATVSPKEVAEALDFFT